MDRILIVDDDAINRVMLCRIMEEEGFAATACCNGADALETARRELPDVIISDALMPEMDGFDFCRRIRSSNVLRDIAFIIYTANYSDGESQELAMAAGADLCLMKPMATDELVSYVRSVLVSDRSSETGRKTGTDTATFMSQHNRALLAKLIEKVEQLNLANAELKGYVVELEAARQNAVEAEGRLQGVMGAIPDAVMATDIHGLVQLCNSRALDLLGGAMAIVKGQPVAACLNVRPRSRYEDLAHVVRDVIMHAREFVAPRYGEVTLPDGRSRLINLSVSPIVDVGDTVLGATVMFRDITDFVHFDDKQRHAEKMQALGELAGGIAHDFRNQLTGIIGFASILQEDFADDPRPDVQEALNMILTSAENSNSLVKQLLNFSRREGVNDPTQLDVNKIVLDVATILSRTCSSSVKVEWDLGEVGEIEGDSTQLQNMLLNLGINARDAMPQGGTMRFSSHMLLGDEGGLPDMVEVWVTDTGYGIPDEVLPRVFDPFFTTKGPGEGTGMGLANVYAAIQNHGGSISVKSEPGSTSFRILLPTIVDSVSCV